MKKQNEGFFGIARKIENKIKPELTIKQIEKVTNPSAFMVQLKNGETKKLSREEAFKIAQSLPSPFKPTGAIDATNCMMKIQSYVSTDRTMREAIHHRKLSFKGKIDPLSHEEFDEILEQKIKSGYDPNRIPKIIEKVKIEHEEHEKQRAIKEAESQKTWEESQRFPNFYKRMIPYVSIKRYQEEIEAKAPTATQEELKECETWTLKTDRLSDTQKSLALGLLQPFIRTKQNEKPKERAKPKKHFGIF